MIRINSPYISFTSRQRRREPRQRETRLYSATQYTANIARRQSTRVIQWKQFAHNKFFFQMAIKLNKTRRTGWNRTALMRFGQNKWCGCLRVGCRSRQPALVLSKITSLSPGTSPPSCLTPCCHVYSLHWCHYAHLHAHTEPQYRRSNRPCRHILILIRASQITQLHKPN